MKFLYSWGGSVDRRFAGVMTTPGHKGIPAGIVAGLPWGADNQAFTKGFSPDRFFPWLESMKPYKERCLFIVVPDKPKNALATIELFQHWYPRFDSWPLAFCGQDGQEDLDFPHAELLDFEDGREKEEYPFSTLFIGGSNKWRNSTACIDVIKRAIDLGKHIHIGRVNWGGWYRWFSKISGSENFTCDGTRQRFDGVDKTITAWLELQDKTNVMKLW